MIPSYWRVELFGGLRVQFGDQVAAQLPKRKTATLLAWLAYYPQQAHSREALAEMLWPEGDPELLQDRFRHTLLDLRRLLEPETAPKRSVLLTSHNGVQLNPDFAEVDVTLFEAGIRAATRATNPEIRLTSLLESLELYKGELLPGYYEDWIAREREHLSERYCKTLCDAAEGLAQRGSFERAIELTVRAVGVEPLHEDRNCQLIRLYSQAGRQAEAERHYKKLGRILREECGESPSPTLQRTFEQTKQRARVSSPTLSVGDAPKNKSPRFEPAGGAVPLDSNFYLVRPVDEEMHNALAHGDSIVLLKGARQTGKTSLLGRGLQQARKTGARIFITDMQKFTGSQMESADALFRMIAEEMIETLELDVNLASFWKSGYGWNVNFERFLRRYALRSSESHLVWALDEVDRLFGFPYSTETFGLFRSWHNERALDPEGPWSRLTLCIAYATEAHLFIKDINQSPFNVGTRLSVDDFNPEQVAEINRRYGSPLRAVQDIERFVQLVGGNPYLVRRGLDALAKDNVSLSWLEENAERDDGVFGDSLRRMLNTIRQDATLAEAILALLSGSSPLTLDNFYRLKSAGVIVGFASESARFRCQLYRAYLEKRLKEG